MSKKGRITCLSPLAAANGFVWPWFMSNTFYFGPHESAPKRHLDRFNRFANTAGLYDGWLIWSHFISATGFVNRKGQFSTSTDRHPQPITKKFVTCDYVGDPYGCAKLGAYPSTGGFWAHGWNITKIFLFIPFLRNSPTCQTCRRIFTHDGSNDVDAPIWGLFHITPHLVGPHPKKTILGRE